MNKQIHKTVKSYFTLCILEQSILRRTRINDLIQIVEQANIEIVTQMTQGHDPVIGFVLEFLKDQLEEQPDQSVTPEDLPKQIAQAKLASYEYADYANALQDVQLLQSMRYRLSPLTLDKNPDWDSVLENLENKQDLYKEKLVSKGIPSYLPEALQDPELHDIFEDCAEGFIAELTLCLFNQDTFSESFRNIRAQFIKLLTEPVPAYVPQEDVHEYLYSHVSAPFEFMTQDIALKMRKNLS